MTLKILGADAVFDGPFPTVMIFSVGERFVVRGDRSRKLKQGGGAELIWEAHRAGREIGYSHLECFAVLPADQLQIVYIPVKIHRASAGCTRAVAIVDE